LTRQTILDVHKLTKNWNNPYVTGYAARESFFLEDRIVLVEGQEDVIAYKLISEKLGQKINGEYFGWGVGGAGNMPTIARLLSELGYARVVGILDSDVPEIKTKLVNEFPNYRFLEIPLADVRTKPARAAFSGTTGLLDEHWKLRPEYSASATKLMQDINQFFDSDTPTV